MLGRPQFWIAAVLVVFLAFIIREFFQPPWKVRKVVNRRGTRTARGMSRDQELKVRRFFDTEFPVERRVVISARRDESGHWRVNCRGRLDEGAKQQIRNFLHSVL